MATGAPARQLKTHARCAGGTHADQARLRRPLLDYTRYTAGTERLHAGQLRRIHVCGDEDLDGEIPTPGDEGDGLAEVAG